ncbi:MAG: GntP family permease [Brachybacterium sp.]|nr:GntP family permease [Brachybacterium sp.]
MVLGIIGIILSLALLITLAYRGVPVIIAAPLCAALALLLSGAPILASYTEVFMPAMAGYIGSYFPVFLLGATFGVLMTVTGFAESIARTVSGAIGVRGAMAATVITSALMTYGGISLFVVAFVMFPLARELFRVADIPKRLIPATIALGIFTFTMTALPGTPQIQNIIPGQFFGTSTYAAPGLGLIGTVLIFGLGLTWLEYRRKTLIASGEHFESPERPRGGGARSGRGSASAARVGILQRALGRGGSGTGSSTSTDAETSPATPRGTAVATDSPDSGPADEAGSAGAMTATATFTPTNRWVPFLPLLVVFVVNFGCTLVIFPAMEWGYLSEEKYGGIDLDTRAGIWAVILALLAAVLTVVALHPSRFGELRSSFVEGVKGSMLPIFSTASEVGYGAVIASVAGFTVIRDAVFGMGGNALVTSVVSTSVTAAITGSSSGGMTIALNAFGEQLRTMAIDQGVSLEAMHRLTAIAAGGLDTLPHSGAVVTLLLVCGMTHRQSYKDLAMVTIVAPVITVIALLALVSAVGSF